ncbi:MAG: [FeFe] hydrogenase H-cluster radical SAM maturase HydG [Proteobacteria bacterium]|nr:[FeFe] hydrogenase H-cluster radical SAM maturase HydG [Pseudomonadota bacterium]
MIDTVIAKAEKYKGLTAEETYELLQCKDNITQEKVLLLASKIKEKIYGKRIVLFSPLYLSSFCNNHCVYCGFSKNNRSIKRKKLSKDEIKNETTYLLKEGVKRILLVSGESDNLEYIIDSISYIYSINHNGNNIRRINVNIAPLTLDGFKMLKEANIGTYQLFQETYNRDLYSKYHPDGPKSDFDFRYKAPFRAIEAGIKDIGMGVLFGLNKPEEDIYFLLKHIEEIKKEFGIGPHTISVPRIKPTVNNSDISHNAPYPIGDDFFTYIIAVLRISIPYTGIILSTREPKELRDKLFQYGVSQISAGSSTTPGGYTGKDFAKQFNVYDERSLSEIVETLISNNFIPSFCTACYRKGRVGEEFMDLAETGKIKNFCDINALLSLAEYVRDFCDDKKRDAVKEFIYRELKSLGLNYYLNKIEKVFSGKKDIYV